MREKMTKRRLFQSPEWHLRALEKMINQVLASDEQALTRLRELDGRTFAIEVDPKPSTFFISVDRDRIVLATHCEDMPAIRVRGSAKDLFDMLRVRGDRGTAISPKVEIQGDLHTVQMLQGVFRDLEIDWEELVARQIGDFPARQLGRLVGGAGQWAGTTQESLEDDLAEYFTYELKLVPHPEELAELATENRDLAAATARLAARVERLRQRREK